MTRRVHAFDVEVRRDRGRSCARWPDGVSLACETGTLELRDTKMRGMDKEQ